ncbi:hypothetical protein FVER14953_05538 [Fusarium verticillioides]|nr:hypothetical protein FVER14953_05538 [Fusarium verticillioides]RBQ91297.1 hypothetical protein FVER53263_05538 [Fusarium verticillioides]
MSLLGRIHDLSPETTKDRLILFFLVYVTCYLTYWTGVVIYRITFHPLAKYPGPFLCRTSWLYQTYYEAFLSGRMLERLPALHQKYGPVVRINPGEVHIKDASVFHQIYKQNTRFTKDPIAYTLGVPNAISMLFDISEHKKRRETLNPSFSKRRILLLEDLMYEELEKVMSHAMPYIERKEPLPIQDAYYCFTADVISHFTFGKSIDLISQPNFSRERVEQLRSFTNSIWILIHFGFIHKIVSALPRRVAAFANEGYQMIFCEGLAQDAVRRHEHSDGKPKELGEETIFDRLLAGNNSKENEADMSRRKQAPKMAAQQIADESVGLLMAGTETTATMLAYGTYYFMTFPEVQAKIMAELATVQRTESGRLPIQQIESLPYFTGFVKETLRFAHGVPGRLTRVVPSGGLYIPSINDYIPEGYVVGMSHMMIHNDPEIFEAPNEFRPERWMGEEGKQLDHWLLTFSKGSRNCLGMNLAYTEMHLMLANVFTRFDLSLIPGTHEDMIWLDRAIVRNRGNLRVMAKLKSVK